METRTLFGCLPPAATIAMLNDVPFHSNPPYEPPGISPFIGRPKRSLYQADSAFGSFAWIAVPPTYSRPSPADDFGAGLAAAAGATGIAGATGHAGAAGRAQLASTSSRTVRRRGFTPRTILQLDAGALLRARGLARRHNTRTTPKAR